MLPLPVSIVSSVSTRLGPEIEALGDPDAWEEAGLGAGLEEKVTSEVNLGSGAFSTGDSSFHSLCSFDGLEEPKSSRLSGRLSPLRISPELFFALSAWLGDSGKFKSRFDAFALISVKGVIAGLTEDNEVDVRDVIGEVEAGDCFSFLMISSAVLRSSTLLEVISFGPELSVC